MTKPGYQHLLTYQQLEEIYDLTNQFCQRFLPGRENLRLREQMVHAARSAKQCLVEGYEQESLKGYIKLAGVSKGSLKELLEDFKDFARNHQVEIWAKGDKRVKLMLVQRKQRKQGPKWTLPLIPFHPFNPLYPVNYMLNLVNMTTYLLDRQIDSLKEKFVKEGGWTETIFKKRLVYRQKQLGFTLVELLITLAIFVTVAAGGVVVWEKKVSPILITTPPVIVSPVPTSPQTPIVTDPDSFCDTKITKFERNNCYLEKELPSRATFSTDCREYSEEVCKDTPGCKEVCTIPVCVQSPCPQKEVCQCSFDREYICKVSGGEWEVFFYDKFPYKENRCECKENEVDFDRFGCLSCDTFQNAFAREECIRRLKAK